VIDHHIQPLFGSPVLRRILRYPPVGVLHEPPGRELWMQVPQMMGGFPSRWATGLWSCWAGHRRFDDSGEVHVQTHRFVVRPSGWELVDEAAM
jgi:hypothetical protein